jgi:hypothetical protein
VDREEDRGLPRHKNLTIMLGMFQQQIRRNTLYKRQLERFAFGLNEEELGTQLDRVKIKP